MTSGSSASASASAGDASASAGDASSSADGRKPRRQVTREDVENQFDTLDLKQ